MFDCKVCVEKEKRIADLQQQVVFFKDAAFPRATQASVTPEYLEMDRMLSGSDEPIHIEETDLDREAASILMGSFDHSQVDID